MDKINKNKTVKNSEISQSLNNAVNNQINAEVSSEYLYYTMAGWAFNNGFIGAGSWFMKQAAEEHTHAMKLFNHIVDREGIPNFGAILQSQNKWNTLLDLFKNVLSHEQGITNRLYNLRMMALTENDLALNDLLIWYIAEQIEEENNAQQIVKDLERLPESNLVWYDREILNERK